MQVDISPLLQAAIGVAATSVPVMGVIALNLITKRFGLTMTVQQQQLAENLLNSAAQKGATLAEGIAAQKGWDHPDVRSETVATGLNWLIGQGAPVLEQAGLAGPNSVTRMQSELQRVAPAAIAAVASSPATTNGPAKAAA